LKRALGLDIGRVRIGVALSDPLGAFAQGIDVLDAEKDWMVLVRDMVREREVGVVVVGIPINTDGSRGPEAERILGIIERLRETIGDEAVEIVPWDERFTTVLAERALVEGDLSRRRRKGVVDKVAASFILQSFLESRRS
jgi:putative Holliday junction resolvase